MGTLVVTPTLDGYINEASPTAVTSTQTFGIIQNLLSSRRRTYLIFDVSALPAAVLANPALITSASLQTECIIAASSAEIYQVEHLSIDGSAPLVSGETTWQQRSAVANWSTLGGDYGDVSYTKVDATIPTSTGVMTAVDVTSGVIATLDYFDYPTQLGLLLKQWSGTDQNWRIATSEHATAMKPTLTITYSEGGTFAQRRSDMNVYNLPRGATSTILHAWLQDDDAATIEGKTGLVHTDITARLVYPGGTLTSLSMATISTLGTWAAPANATTIGFKLLDDTNAPGLYEIHLPDGMISGIPASAREFHITLKATDLAPTVLQIKLYSNRGGNASDFRGPACGAGTLA